MPRTQSPNWLNRPAPGVHVQPDFYYNRENLQGVCVFVDGPHHDGLGHRCNTRTRRSAHSPTEGTTVHVSGHSYQTRPPVHGTGARTSRRATTIPVEERNPEEQYQWLEGLIDPNSSLEMEFLRFLRGSRIRLPDNAQNRPAPGVGQQRRAAHMDGQRRPLRDR